MSTRKPPGNFVCPVCSAGVGQRCLTMTPDKPPRETNYHVARLRVAAEVSAIQPRNDFHDAWAELRASMTDLGHRTRRDTRPLVALGLILAGLLILGVTLGVLL